MEDAEVFTASKHSKLLFSLLKSEVYAALDYTTLLVTAFPVLNSMRNC